MSQVEDAQPTPRPEPPRESLAVKVWRQVKEIVLILVLALVISAVLRAFVGQLFVIPSGSMENTLMPGDRVVAVKPLDVHRGDIVVFKDSQRWMGDPPPRRTGLGRALEFVGLLPDTSSNYLVKRVIGMPGDTVECCDPQGRLVVNGHSLDESSYLYRDPAGHQVAPSAIRFKVVVPQGHIFVMGDHRDASGDSRYHLTDVDPNGYRGSRAFIALDDVVGPTKAIVFPLSRFRVITHPPSDLSAPPDRVASAPPRGEVCVGSTSCR